MRDSVVVMGLDQNAMNDPKAVKSTATSNIGEFVVQGGSNNYHLDPFLVVGQSASWHVEVLGCQKSIDLIEIDLDGRTGFFLGFVECCADKSGTSVKVDMPSRLSRHRWCWNGN